MNVLEIAFGIVLGKFIWCFADALATAIITRNCNATRSQCTDTDCDDDDRK